MISFMGKTADEWASIYQLLTFQGREVKSLKDMMYWRAPDSPKECLEVGLELIEAQAKVDKKPLYEMLERFACESQSS